MLAFAWPWANGGGDRYVEISRRLGASLCAGIGGAAAATELDGLHFAYRPLRPNPALSRTWRPATLPNGRISAFHGYFDNAAAIAAELSTDQSDLGRLYGLAVERWGDDTEKRVIGEYCAIIIEPGDLRVRLSRSPRTAR